MMSAETNKAPEEVIINATEAIRKVKDKYTDVPIGICNILPRKGKRGSIMTFDETTANVNVFLNKRCQRDPVLTEIDCHADCMPNSNVTKSIYDTNDPVSV